MANRASAVLTLVATEGALEEAYAHAARKALVKAEAREVSGVDWLLEGTACDLAFGGLEPAVAAEAVRRALAGAPVDVHAQPIAGRRKRLLVADMESTLVRNEMLDELAALIGAGDEVRAITARAMNGELDFAAALRRRVALLAGRPVALLERAWARLEPMPGAAALIATCRARGVATAMVSGGFHVFADRVGALLGCDHVAANRLEIAGDLRTGTLTGRVVEPILDGAAKRRILEARCAELGIAPADAVAVGDGANDLAMLGAAGLGIAFRAKPAVAAAARARIDHADLRAVLFFQGYRGDEIVAVRDDQSERSSRGSKRRTVP